MSIFFCICFVYVPLVCSLCYIHIYIVFFFTFFSILRFFVHSFLFFIFRLNIFHSSTRADFFVFLIVFKWNTERSPVEQTHGATYTRARARVNPRAGIRVHAPTYTCYPFFFFRLDYILHIIGFTLDCLLGGGIFLGGFICGRINCMRGGAANRERTESRGMRPIINADSFFLCIWPNSLKRYPFTERQKKKRM